MQSMIHTMLDFLLISLPEKIFVTCMILILFKRFDLLDIRMWKQNIKWIMIPSIATASCISFMKYIIVLPKLFISTSMLVVLWITMFYIINKLSIIKEKKLIIRIVAYSLITLLIISLIEIAYIPLSLSLSKLPYDFFNNNILYMFLLAIPSRILEFSIITYFVVKMNDDVNIKLYDTVFKNKTITRITIFFISFLTIFLMYVVKLIGYNNILINLSIIEQVTTIGFVLSMPTVLLTVLWFMINYIISVEKRVQQMYENLND